MTVKRINSLFLILVVCFTFISIETQAKQRSDRGKDHEEMMESMLKFKQDFIAKRLDLSREQQNKFFPLYDEMNEEIMKVNSDSRDAQARISQADEDELGDIDYEMATNVMIEKGEKIAEIEKKYYAKFKDILTRKQLYLLKTGEQEINRRFLEHIRKK